MNHQILRKYVKAIKGAQGDKSVALAGSALLFIPMYQFDLVLLASSGAALIIIVILLILIAVIFFLMRRRSATPPPRQADIVTVVGKKTRTGDLSPGSSGMRPSAFTDHATTQPSLPSEDPDLVSTQMSVTSLQPQTTPVSGQRPSNINWQIAGLTDVGQKRDLNEDNLLLAETEVADRPFGLYIVADGMGGHEHGEIASQLTIDTIYSHFEQAFPTNTPYEDWMNGAIEAANKAVIARQTDNNSSRKMGSTLVMSLVSGGKAHIANVGDSRAYHLTNNEIKQISVDHSLVERLIEIGQITREEARTHKQRNVIYSTIGDKTKMQIGLYQVNLSPGDRLLLCSDGLTNMLTDEEILNINRSQASPVEACRTLVKAANMAGGEDNITALIIEMDSSPS
ncbi:MAG: Stp1/IreP family PP2C-type Ser/Thr phosphatase [Anaerolineae bacterium]|nr:Stp1/IreP family PP2C-type Ser/Thr phosphatase [Anaerolineae bacterium]